MINHIGTIKAKPIENLFIDKVIYLLIQTFYFLEHKVVRSFGQLGTLKAWAQK